jgi:hypothetical protein
VDSPAISSGNTWLISIWTSDLIISSARNSIPEPLMFSLVPLCAGQLRPRADISMATDDRKIERLRAERGGELRPHLGSQSGEGKRLLERVIDRGILLLFTEEFEVVIMIADATDARSRLSCTSPQKKASLTSASLVAGFDRIQGAPRENEQGAAVAAPKQQLRGPLRNIDRIDQSTRGVVHEHLSRCDINIAL